MVGAILGAFVAGMPGAIVGGIVVGGLVYWMKNTP